MSLGTGARRARQRPQVDPTGARTKAPIRLKFLATWRSGYAAACKAVYTGSIPVVALLGQFPFSFQFDAGRGALAQK
jgi:hypothetical protein